MWSRWKHSTAAAISIHGRSDWWTVNGWCLHASGVVLVQQGFSDTEKWNMVTRGLLLSFLIFYAYLKISKSIFNNLILLAKNIEILWVDILTTSNQCFPTTLDIFEFPLPRHCALTNALRRSTAADFKSPRAAQRHIRRVAPSLWLKCPIYLPSGKGTPFFPLSGVLLSQASLKINRTQVFLGMGWDFYGLTTIKPDNIFMLIESIALGIYIYIL